MNKLLITLFFVTTVVFGFLYYKEVSTFPITLYICGPGYTDCFPAAKYDDRTSCENANKKGNWLCDSIDKNNIKCKESDNSFAVGYCK